MQYLRVILVAARLGIALSAAQANEYEIALRRPFQPRFGGGGGGKELCYEGGCYAGDVILTMLKASASIADEGEDAEPAAAR